MRLKSINDRMNTCNECGFTAFFMYKDAAGCPLCPKCHGSDIKEFQDLMADLDDELEAELDLYNEESLVELKF